MFPKMIWKIIISRKMRTTFHISLSCRGSFPFQLPNTSAMGSIENALDEQFLLTG